MKRREEKVQEEIIRRVLERSDIQQQEKLKQLETESTLESLQEITGLPLEELEKIAEEVKASFVQDKGDFFSIKNQIFFVIILGLVCVCILLLLFFVF